MSAILPKAGELIMLNYPIYLQASDNKPCQFLNIYSEWEPGSEFNLESVARK